MRMWYITIDESPAFMDDLMDGGSSNPEFIVSSSKKGCIKLYEHYSGHIWKGRPKGTGISFVK